MSATSIFFNGRVIRRSGSYSEVDASGLAQVGLGATGIVAVLGTGVGGIPVGQITEAKEFLRFSNAEKMMKTFRSGDLREAANLAFQPSNDPDILAGAQEVVAMKVNPATQSTASFANAQGTVINAESIDYGAFTAQINISIGTGTNQGKLLTITFEDVVETVDDLGGDDMFQLMYSGGSDGYTTMVAQVENGGAIKCTGTRTAGGGSASITQLGGNALAEVVSANAGDTTQKVTVYGLNAGGDAQEEEISLNGTTPVAGLLTFSKIYGARLSAVAVGNVTVRDAPTDTSVLVITAGQLRTAVSLFEYGYVNNATLSIAADNATVKNLVIVGKNAAGAKQLAKVTLNGTTPVVTVGVTWSMIDFIVTGDLEAARTATITAEAAKATPTVQTTLKKAADYFNAKKVVIAGPATRGFIFTMVTSQTSFLLSDLDITVGTVNIKDPANPGFKADIYALVAWVNQNSQYVSFERVAGVAGGAPTNTASPVFLTGGGEGTAQFSDWQTALNLLKQVRVNAVVVLTGDPAVHAAVDAHCAYMGGIGRSERDGCVGLMNAGLTDVPTKTEIQTQIIDLNTRHLRAAAQAIERFDSAGERKEFMPPFQALCFAAMSAGAPIGTSLTNKYANVLGIRQHSTWNPIDDAEEMIAMGLCFMENVDGVGRRVVRNITTHLSTSNIAYVEASVNQAVNFAVYEFRTAMEIVVGKRGFSGTVNGAKGTAIGKLGLLVDSGAIVDHRALNIELAVDVMELSVEMAPVIPVNFVKSTIHLVTVRQTAA